MRTGKAHLLWSVVWLAGLCALLIWDSFFLNGPAFTQLRTAFANTILAGAIVVILATALGWAAGSALHLLETRRRPLYLSLTFVLNIIRSIPQIVGVLGGYVVLTLFIQRELVQSRLAQLVWIACSIALFVFLEVADLVRDRIRYYQTLDFYPAMLCCGIREGRIINREILWKNSRAHLLRKMISILGVAVFLQCSIDFVVSVGLSTDVSLSNFPVTLGSLLAKLDSKQDILAIGTVLLNPLKGPSLLFEHLQGISVAFLIVFTLLCVYKISNGLVKRYNL